MKKIEKIIYVAAVVKDPVDLEKHIDPQMPNRYCHHVTLKYGGIDELPEFIGREISFGAGIKASNDKAVALFGCVDDFDAFRYAGVQQQHITICTATGVAPAYSNQLKDEGCCERIEIVNVPCTIGAFVVFDDDSTGWVFDKDGDK